MEEVQQYHQDGKPLPSDPISFSAAIDVLAAANLADQQDPGLKTKWRYGMHNCFCTWFKLSMPEAHKVKESKKAGLQQMNVQGGDLLENVNAAIAGAEDVIVDKVYLTAIEERWFD